MAWWQPIALVLFCAGLAAVLTAAGFAGHAWRKARTEMRSFDIEYALFTDEFGGDGLWP